MCIYKSIVYYTHSTSQFQQPHYRSLTDTCGQWLLYWMTAQVAEDTAVAKTYPASAPESSQCSSRDYRNMGENINKTILLVTSVKKKTKHERGYIRGNDQEDFLEEITFEPRFHLHVLFLQWSPNISYVLPCVLHIRRGMEWRRVGCQDYQIPPDSKKVGHKSAVKNRKYQKEFELGSVASSLFSARLFRTNVISS